MITPNGNQVGAIMKNLISGLTACGILAFSAAATAQQTSSGTPTASKHQMMKECMNRQLAKNDGSTKSQMKSFCKADIESSKSTAQPVPNETTPAPTESPPASSDTPQ
jgi:predicted lipoprotein